VWCAWAGQRGQGLNPCWRWGSLDLNIPIGQHAPTQTYRCAPCLTVHALPRAYRTRQARPGQPGAACGPQRPPGPTEQPCTPHHNGSRACAWAGQPGAACGPQRPPRPTERPCTPTPQWIPCLHCTCAGQPGAACGPQRPPGPTERPCTPTPQWIPCLHCTCAGQPGAACGPQQPPGPTERPCTPTPQWIPCLHCTCAGQPGAACGPQCPYARLHRAPGPTEGRGHLAGSHEQPAVAPERAAGVPGHGQQGPGGEGADSWVCMTAGCA